MTDLIVNLSDPRETANLIAGVRRLRGMHRVTLKQHRKTRSSQANRFYWGVVLPAFTEFRHGQGEEFDDEQAHEFFKLKFLRKTVVNMTTGEAIGSTVRSTTTLSTTEFAEYIDKITAWLSEFGIQVQDAMSV
jgi:hypothetical protein